MSGLLQHSPADVVRWLLIQKSAGTSPRTSPLAAWPIYDTNEPNSPDELITIFDTFGRDNGRIMPTGEAEAYEGFQVRVRAGLPNVGWVRANLIREVLAKEIYDDVVTIGSTTYVVHSINNIGAVIPLGKEVPLSKRSIFTLNAMICFEQAPLGV